MVKCSEKKCEYCKEGKCTCEKVLQNFEPKAVALLLKCNCFKQKVQNN